MRIQAAPYSNAKDLYRRSEIYSSRDMAFEALRDMNEKGYTDVKRLEPRPQNVRGAAPGSSIDFEQRPAAVRQLADQPIGFDRIGEPRLDPALF
jgi:hypothetical protein